MPEELEAAVRTIRECPVPGSEKKSQAWRNYLLQRRLSALQEGRSRKLFDRLNRVRSRFYNPCVNYSRP
jgi:hypothetical protein